MVWVGSRVCLGKCGVYRGVWCVKRSVVHVGECGLYRGLWCV